ncbi:MAG TPA: hypothetical protein VMU04_23165 [Candidatus Acidoferrum sp.]|nr:hypothetical protein [Candidatus Acidoferrum sp.]
MQRTNIAPEILQPFLEAVPNAADEGQSQFDTPVELGRRLALPLARARPTVVDLNCGAGHLLHATVGRDTTLLLGADIDPCRGQRVEGASLPINRITADASQLHAWLKEVGFLADCFVLNPPWGLFFRRERLAALAESELPAVRLAFKGIEERLPKGTIDSTIAMLLAALDLCTPYGEGLLIGNDATLQRLLFDPGAPHGAAAAHVWAHLVIPGNPMTARNHCQWQTDKPFQTGVLYFARDHTAGSRRFDWPNLPDRSWRQGVELRNAWLANNTNAERWHAARERAGEAAGSKPKVPWNLWLAEGTIHTGLSLFQKHSRKIDKSQVRRLFALNGKTPMDLVIQRHTRDELLVVAEQSGWRVQPELLAAVRSAIQQYHAARAPLYPLPEIQRLGYLDEEDIIECKADLADADGQVIFHQGQRYALRSETVGFSRLVTRPNSFTGEEEELQYSGQELAFLISTPDGTEWCFMDAWLRDDPTTTVGNPKRLKANRNDRPPVDFTLQDLVAHFVIPEVPDVAAVQPEAYGAMVTRLAELETALA